MAIAVAAFLALCAALGFALGWKWGGVFTEWADTFTYRQRHARIRAAYRRGGQWRS